MQYINRFGKLRDVYHSKCSALIPDANLVDSVPNNTDMYATDASIYREGA
jgi:hypothetical protein